LIADFAERADPTPDGRGVQGPWRSVEFAFRLASEEP
jgi:hypothetical protein